VAVYAMISEKGGSKKKKNNAIVKWEGKIGKSLTLSTIFTKLIKSRWEGI